MNNKQEAIPASPESFVGSLPHVGRNVIPFVVRKGSKMSDELFEALRAFIELHAHSITGFSNGLVIDESPTGQQTIDYHGKTLRLIAAEKYGKPLGNALENYARFAQDGMWAGQLQRTIGVLFIEPDPTYTKVVDAWYYEDFRIKNITGVVSRRDLLNPAGVAPKLSEEEDSKLPSMEHLERFKKRQLEDAQFTVAMHGEIHKGPEVVDFASKVLTAEISRIENVDSAPAGALSDSLRAVYAEGLAKIFPGHCSGADA